jgi:hypothetical protein
MASVWCPWCGAELSAAPADEQGPSGKPAERVCPSCKAKVPAGSLLSAPPQSAIKPGDPDARQPAPAPTGGSPLPQGTPDPTTEGIARFVAWIVFGLVMFGLVAKFVAGPAISHVTPEPATPTATATPSATAT